MVGWTTLIIVLAGCGLAGLGDQANNFSSGNAYDARESANGGRDSADTSSQRYGGGPVASVRDQEVLDSLEKGGYVILLRLLSSEGAGDRDSQARDDYSPDNRMRETGEALQQLSVPVGQVLSSPDPAALEISAREFGHDQVETTDALRLQDPSVVQRVDEPDTGLRRLLSTAPPAGENTVLIATVTDDENLETTKSEAVVFKPLGNDSFQRVALLTLKQWTALAHDQR